MKVLVVDNSPGMGGSVHHLVSQVNGLRPMGVRYRIIASKPELFAGLLPESATLQGLSAPAFRDVFKLTGAMYRPVLPGILNRPFSYLAYRRFAREVASEFREVLKDFAPDVVHLNNLNLPNKAFADALGAKRPPLVVAAMMIRLFSRSEADFAEKADAVFCISKAVVDCLAEQMPGLPRERLRVIESPIVLANYNVARDAAVRAEFGIPEDAKLVLSLGRLTPWKGHDVLVRALAKIPGVWLLQAGGEEAGCRREVDRLVREAGMEGRVVFAGVRSDVPRLLAASDLLAHSSKFGRPRDGVVEAFGRVIAEGLAAGLPVVATNAGGASEILENSEAGHLVPPGDAEAMAEAIRFYLDNPETARRAGEAGRKRSEKYDEALLADKLFALYRQVIEAHGR